jgi:hypothetical protein
VKMPTDKDRNRVNFKPTETRVAKLASIPIHEIPYLTTAGSSLKNSSHM